MIDDLDMSRPLHAGMVLLAITTAFAACAVMDRRQPPPGRVKWVPWSVMSIMLVAAALGVGRLVLADLVSA